MTAVDNTLAARGKHYEGPGGYADTALSSQMIKQIVRSSPNFRNATLTPAMCETLDMIANKLARILNGNPFHADTWHDIAGYATLIEKQLAPPAIKPEALTTCGGTSQSELQRVAVAYSDRAFASYGGTE